MGFGKLTLFGVFSKIINKTVFISGKHELGLNTRCLLPGKHEKTVFINRQNVKTDRERVGISSKLSEMSEMS